MQYINGDTHQEKLLAIYKRNIYKGSISNDYCKTKEIVNYFNFSVAVFYKELVEMEDEANKTLFFLSKICFNCTTLFIQTRHS